MAEYGLLLRMPFLPTLVKYAAEKAEEGGEKAHLEVGTVPQQVSLSSNTEYGYIKQQGTRGPASLYGILLGSAAGQGAPRL